LHASEETEGEGATTSKDEVVELQNAKTELESELKLERAKAEDYLRRLQYLQAEFDNYRKRVEREGDEMSKVAADKLLVSLLGLFDELRIAIDVTKKTDDKDVIVSGLEMVLKKLEALFASEGLKPIDAVGKRFNPNLHEVIGRVDSGDAEGRIVEEVRKGFTLRGKVIRSSLVKVGAAPNESEDEQQSGD
jgi:molecular chaperone GrpE